MSNDQDETTNDTYTGVRIRVSTSRKLKILASLADTSMMDVVSGLVDEEFDKKIKRLASDPSAFIE